jgi:hypothetical protein
MCTSLTILAQPLAPDYIWFALLFVAALVLMHGLAPLGSRVAARQHPQHHLHGISHRLHELIAHKHS